MIKTLLEKADKVIIVGGMVFTFDKAQGKEVGSSLVEEDKVPPFPPAYFSSPGPRRPDRQTVSSHSYVLN